MAYWNTKIREDNSLISLLHFKFINLEPYMIKKIIFEDIDKTNKEFEKEDIRDISRDKDNSVIVKIIEDTVKIQFKGKLVFNEDCSILFERIYNLESIEGLENIDTSNVTNMQSMFSKCESLKELDLSSFNTSNVTNMEYMFEDCKNLKKIDLSSFDTSNVTDMKYMFYNCESLENIDLSSFNTSNLKDIFYMFGNCKTLKLIDISNFNTSKLVFINYAFSQCSSVEEIDLRSYDPKTFELEDFESAFDGCDNLKHIYVQEDFLKILDDNDIEFINEEYLDEDNDDEELDDDQIIEYALEYMGLSEDIFEVK